MVAYPLSYKSEFVLNDKFLSSVFFGFKEKIIKKDKIIKISNK
jgi:hypothetical protein